MYVDSALGQSCSEWAEIFYFSQLQTDGLPGGNRIQTSEGLEQIKQQGCPSCSCRLSKQHCSCKQSVLTQ